MLSASKDVALPCEGSFAAPFPRDGADRPSERAMSSRLESVQPTTPSDVRTLTKRRRSSRTSSLSPWLGGADGGRFRGEILAQIERAQVRRRRLRWRLVGERLVPQAARDRRRRTAARESADSEIVHAFERRAALPADQRCAIAANQWIVHRAAGTAGSKIRRLRWSDMHFTFRRTPISRAPDLAAVGRGDDLGRAFRNRSYWLIKSRNTASPSMR